MTEMTIDYEFLWPIGNMTESEYQQARILLIQCANQKEFIEITNECMNNRKSK